MSTNSIVKTNKNSITDSVHWSEEQIDLIKKQVCQGTDDELKLFLYVAQRAGLDPLTRQIYAVFRPSYNSKTRDYESKMTIQTSIDGFRLIAERSGKYAGQLGPFWCGEDGLWHDVWLSKTPPIAAKVAALRVDFKEPLWGVAKFDTYAQKTKDGSLNTMWTKMSDLMIAKCAEALALRKAFPQELSGLYTADEMAQAESSTDSPKKDLKVITDVQNKILGPDVKQTVLGITYDQKNEIAELTKQLGWDPGTIKNRFKMTTGKESSKEWDHEDYEKVMLMLNNVISQNPQIAGTSTSKIKLNSQELDFTNS